MHYNEAPDYVDLGLPSGNIWMKHLLGMHSDTDIENALYFQWGDTIGYTRDTAADALHNYEDYKHCNGTFDTLTKYVTSAEYGYNGFVDNKTQLDIEDDAVHFIHQKWRMPTRADLYELINNTTHENITIDGILGMKLTSIHNANFIFLPFIGYLSNSMIYQDTQRVYISSSSLSSPNRYNIALYVLAEPTPTAGDLYATTVERAGAFCQLGIKIQN